MLPNNLSQLYITLYCLPFSGNSVQISQNWSLLLQIVSGITLFGCKVWLGQLKAHQMFFLVNIVLLLLYVLLLYIYYRISFEILLVENEPRFMTNIRTICTIWNIVYRYNDPAATLVLCLHHLLLHNLHLLVSNDDVALMAEDDLVRIISNDDGGVNRGKE